MRIVEHETKNSNCDLFECSNCENKCITQYTYAIYLDKNKTRKVDLILCENCYEKLKRLINEKQ